MTFIKKPKLDIQQEVTNQIIDLLEQVNLDDYKPPFAQLSAQGMPQNPTTNLTYQGINIINLWMQQQRNKFTSNHWATFKQWKANGANVIKGQKGSPIVFYKTLIKSEENAKGEQEDIKIPMLKTYTVFNANQVEGYEPSQEENLVKTSKVEHLKQVDDYCTNTKAIITQGVAMAYYDVKNDYINMPADKYFLDTSQASATENYYATLLHELTHWTGAKNRLDRHLNANATTQDYAFEELVAELGSAFLCSQHDITQIQPDQNAIYIKGWLKALKDNKAYIFKAAAQASKAVGYLNELQVE